MEAREVEVMLSPLDCCRPSSAVVLHGYCTHDSDIVAIFSSALPSAVAKTNIWNLFTYE